MRRIFPAILAFALLPACDSVHTVQAGKLELTPGAEDSPWEQSPSPTAAKLYTVTADGTRRDGQEVDVPIEALNVSSEDISEYGFDGFDDAGHRVVGARSLLLDSMALADASLPLFFSRTNAFARPPGELALPPGPVPANAVLQGRYWVTVVPRESGTMTVEAYDLLAWGLGLDGLELECPASPCVPTAVACSDWTLMILGESWGIWVDLETGDSGEVPLPDGLDSFDVLAGARTVNSPADRAFLVGPTRAGEATDAVLALAPDKTLTLLRTREPRSAAAAIWADGIGLVVVGGSSEAPAVEVLDDDDEFVELAFPAFPARSTQVTFDAPRLVSLGGRIVDGSVAAGASFDLSCDEDCEAVVLPVELDMAGGVAAKSDSATYTLVGTDTDGDTVGAVVNTTEGSIVSIPLPRGRQDASYSMLPTGHLGAMGGTTSEEVSERQLEFVLP